MTETPNYHLKQWEPEDKVRRTDFNADNLALDAALHEIATGGIRLEIGTYVGNGDKESYATITTSISPKFVFVGRGRFTLLTRDYTSACSFSSTTYDLIVQWRTKSVSWKLSNTTYRTADEGLNGEGQTYYYLAIG